MSAQKKHTKVAGGNTNPRAKTKKSDEVYRNWIFTSWKKEHEPNFCAEKIKYLCYGEEHTQAGQFHWQGFVCFKNAKTMRAAQKILGDPVAHMKVMKGTIEENEIYCSKEGKYKEHGERPAQGKRNDIQKMSEDIYEGKMTRKDVAFANVQIYNQFRNTLKDFEDWRYENKERTETTEGIWIYGKTGTGKSHMAFDLAKGKTKYVLEDDGGWWDNYLQQDVVIINDFRGWIKYSELLTLVDHWPKSVRRRGRAPINFNSKQIIITSSLHPKDIYKNRDKEDDIAQLLRRFEIIKLTKKYEK